MTAQAPTLTQRKFESGIEVIGLILPNLIDTPGKIEALYFCLQDLTDAEFERGVRLLALTHREFYPNTNLVALFREYALGADTKTGVEAWGEVQKALADMGRIKFIQLPETQGLTPEQAQEAWKAYDAERARPREFQIGDPIADRVARSMGIKYLRYSTSEEMDRAHFIRAYEQLRDAEARRRVAKMP